MAVGRHDEGAWNKALAVEAALQQTDSTVLVVHDADVWADGLSEAIQAVLDDAAWAIPHKAVFRLTEASTARYMAGERHENLPLTQPAYGGFEGGGITVVRRDVYEACPLDARFVGWGQEDAALGTALRCLYGSPVRLKHPLVHLFHPPQSRQTRARGSDESWALWGRYLRARRNRDAMRALIEEAKACRLQPC